jgi:hypothetical protein
MLCFAGSVVTSRSTYLRSARRADVPRQLEFWTAEQPLPPGAPQWKDLNAEEHTTVIALLVRMITKAVHPRPTHEKEEKLNER